MNSEGIIYRRGTQHIVEVPWQDHYQELPGVEKARGSDEDIARKTFERKRVYLPDEYDVAIENHITGHNVIVFSMNGYTTISEDRLHRWLLTPGLYEQSAARALFETVHSAVAECPGIDPRFIHGAVRKGIDGSTISIAEQFGRPHLGFNCPQFMIYVDDDEDPVYVAETKQGYVDAYTRSLDVLIAMNGGKHSFDQDIRAAINHKKRVILVNLIEALTLQKTSPIGPDGEIEDAVTAFMQLVSIVGRSDEYLGEDRYTGIVSRISAIAKQYCRNHLTPEVGYRLPLLA